MRSPRLISRLFAAVVVVAALCAVPAASVSAHTELDFTLPADGTTVGEPIDEISVGFTEPVTLIGNGFRVLDPTTGAVLEPFVVTDDDMIFRLQLDPPLGGGQVGVEYEVASADGHIVSGSFVFTVAAPAPTTPPPTAAPTAPPATQAPTTPTTAAPAPTTTTGAVIAPPPSSSVSPSTSEPVETTTPPSDADGDNSTLIIAGAAVVAAAAIAFLLVRSRKAT